MDNYVFPCVFIYEDDGIAILFPDLDGCVSFGENEQQAFYNAKESLTLHLYGMEQDNEPIPKPSLIKDISLDENEQAVFIEVFMPPFRAKQANKYVKKTLTIPEWLNIIAEKNDVNFSQILQNALKDYLNLQKIG
ncbi:MAG: type II toxin-antitoxin system HicB family antitoxin [Lachnospiraceae bacterium]|nr:type II toxin-antitoxin system HicB family antitoxin [Lachnospiraceae bacterium]